MTCQENCLYLRNRISRAHIQNLPQAPQNLPSTMCTDISLKQYYIVFQLWSNTKY